MNRLLPVLALIGGLMVMLLALLTALVSASASLANGVANAAASSALLISQCTSTMMIVVALTAGGILGAGIVRLQLHPPQSPAPKWLPGPNARLQRLDAASHPHLPPPQSQALEYTQVPVVADAEEDTVLPLQGWGF